VASYVTVPEGRLTLTDILLVDDPRPLGNSVHFLRYGAKPGLDVGVGYWATPGKLRPAVNWQVTRAVKNRPAVLIGYGSEPLGEWKDDGVYLSLVKGFGPRRNPTYAFAAYFREIGGHTNHLIGGVNQPIGRRWSFFVGRYPFNTWNGSVSYQLSPRTQLGLWACDFGRSCSVGLSMGTGWSLRRK
jgi:hypothetical protein